MKIDTSKLSGDWTIKQVGDDLHLKHAECDLIIYGANQDVNDWGWPGSTNFTYEGSSYSFDRRGIEDSFYMGGKHCKYKTLEEAAEAQVLRVIERKKAIKEEGGYVCIPDTTISITNKRKNELIAQLKNTGVCSVYPRGFGTGYTFTTRRQNRWDNPCSPKHCAFFGVTKLYYSTIDCD